jgi:hypothetical protein
LGHQGKVLYSIDNLKRNVDHHLQQLDTRIDPTAQLVHAHKELQATTSGFLCADIM